MGTLEAEGFTTLWKEDAQGRLIEVMDDVKKGAIGLPLAYWTSWTGRTERNYHTRCNISFGPEHETVVDYDQSGAFATADGYWYCAFTRFSTDLDTLEPGEYHFSIVVDGRAVAERSIRIEARLFTPFRLMALVLVAGLGLLAFLRRNHVRLT